MDSPWADDYLASNEKISRGEAIGCIAFVRFYILPLKQRLFS
jgi:hypothetical protein